MARKKAAPSEQTIEREKLALTMRRDGSTLAEIAEAVGVNSEQAASRVVSRAMARHTIAPSAELRQVEYDRLEALHRSVWDAALAGDLKAFNAALGASAARRSLMGLDHSDRMAEAYLELEQAKYLDWARAIDGALNDAGVAGEAREAFNASMLRRLDASDAERMLL